MAKISIVQKNLKRIRIVAAHCLKRKELKDLIYDKKLSLEDRFKAQLQLASMPRDGSRTRVRNRCELTGRGRGFYRKFRISRICLRELASKGDLPGVKKSSW